MLKNRFETQIELDMYIVEQKIRKENKGLTVSERKQLEELIQNPKAHIQKTEIKPAGLPIVTNINELRKPCIPIEKGEDISGIIRDLKDTLTAKGGLGITANQVGIDKKISYVKIPKFVDKNKQIQYNEYILINAKIIEKDRPIKVQDEGCISFPGIYVHTYRYVYITVEYLDEKLNPQVMSYQDLESFCITHEIDHQNGLTIFDRKWRNK